MPGVAASTRKAWPPKQRLTSIVGINDLGQRLGCRSEVLTSAAQGSEEGSGLVGGFGVGLLRAVPRGPEHGAAAVAARGVRRRGRLRA